MAFEKITENVENISLLADTPAMTPTELKAEFDKGNKIIKTAFNQLIDELNNNLFPIGFRMYVNNDNDYSNHLGFTWQKVAKGKVLVGKNENDTDFNLVGKTGGTKTHKHLMPFIVDNTLNWGKFQWNSSSQFNGSERAVSPDSNCINNTPTGEEFNGYRLYSGDGSSLQPYEVVNIWERIS